MFRKHDPQDSFEKSEKREADLDSSEYRASSTSDVVTSPSSGWSSQGGSRSERTYERSQGTMGRTLEDRVDDATRTASDITHKAVEAGEDMSREAGRRVAEIRDVTEERLAEAGDAVRKAAEEVDIEEFRLKGSVAGYPFSVDLEGEGGERYLAFEVNLQTEGGDTLKITGRKSIAAGKGSFGGSRSVESTRPDRASESPSYESLPRGGSEIHRAMRE